MSASSSSTFRNTRHRAYCFTINNPTEEHTEALEAVKLRAKYMVWQKEQGEAGTPHFQGYVSLKTQVSFNTMRTLLPGAHLSAARGSAAHNTTYCTKEEGRLEGPWTHGSIPSQGRRNDLERLADTIRDEGLSTAQDKNPTMVIRYHRGMQALASHYSTTQRVSEGFVKPKIIVYWGPTGSGKTRKAYKKDKLLYACSSHTDTLWFDGYVGQKTILFDDFKGGIKYRRLLQLTGGYPFSAPIKGGFVMLTHKTIIFTSNFHPDNWYLQDTPEFKRRLREFGTVKYIGDEEDDASSSSSSSSTPTPSSSSSSAGTASHFHPAPTEVTPAPRRRRRAYVPSDSLN